jgi:UDP-glucuronate 4-epimerase
VRPSLIDPAGYLHANVMGTQALLTEASRAHCDRVVLASSSSVYGDSTPVPFREDADVSRPISPYAASKRACELIAATHHHLTGLPIGCLRFFTVFGPRQRPDLAIALFLNKIARGEPITMFGDGSMSRDFTYIDDIVVGVLAAHDRISAHGYRIWNLGHHQPVLLRDMIATVERVVGKRAEILHQPHQPGDVQRTYADITRARDELGFDPRTPFEEGVRRQWAAMS